MSVLDKLRLDGKVAIMTGAGRGLGHEMALALAEAGADIVAAARTQAQLDETAALVRAKGRRCLAIPTDITDSAAVNAMVDIHRALACPAGAVFAEASIVSLSRCCRPISGGGNIEQAGHCCLELCQDLRTLRNALGTCPGARPGHQRASASAAAFRRRHSSGP